MIPYSVELEPGAGTIRAAPCTPLWARDLTKNSFSAAWNSCSQPGFIRRVMATWTGCEFELAAITKKKREGGGEGVNVPATRLMDVAAGQEMNVRRLEADVPLNLPVQIHIECSSDVAGSVAERGNLDESRHGIHGIVARVPPKRTRASVNRSLWQGVHRKVRMDANDILRPDQAGIVEVTGFEEERVEGSEVPIIWIAVTAGGAGLESEPRIPRRVPGIAYIYRRAPRED